MLFFGREDPFMVLVAKRFERRRPV